MAIEAPVSKYNKNNLKLYIGFLLILSAALAYDGYLSQYEWSKRTSFYEKHVTDGVPDGTMKFNRIFPFIGLAGIAWFGYRLYAIQSKKVVVDDNTLTVDGDEIPLDSIESIDKTHYEKKGNFTVTYRRDNETRTLALSDRSYDNLSAVLDHIVAKIS